MKFFLILLIVGFTVLIFGALIHINFDNCASDLRIGGRNCVPHWLYDLATAAFFVGLGCVLSSFGFLLKRKSRNDSIFGDKEN